MEEMMMNKPDTSGYQALVIDIGNFKWVQCPHCGKRQFQITPGAIILGQHFQCRGSNCKQTYEVNYK